MDTVDVNVHLYRVREAALRSVLTNDYPRDSDPHADASAEHADEGLALAARELVLAVDALPPNERPIGWVPVISLNNGVAEIPAGLDARPATHYTVHCSHCGKAAPGYESETPSLWSADDLSRLGNYHLDECDWKVNLPGGADPEFGSRMLVCPECWLAGWCETCGSEIHAWQPVVTDPTDQSKWHEGCGSPQLAEAVA